MDCSYNAVTYAVSKDNNDNNDVVTWYFFISLQLSLGEFCSGWTGEDNIIEDDETTLLVGTVLLVIVEVVVVAVEMAAAAIMLVVVSKLTMSERSWFGEVSWVSACISVCK